MIMIWWEGGGRTNRKVTWTNMVTMMMKGNPLWWWSFDDLTALFEKKLSFFQGLNSCLCVTRAGVNLPKKNHHQQPNFIFFLGSMWCDDREREIHSCTFDILAYFILRIDAWVHFVCFLLAFIRSIESGLMRETIYKQAFIVVFVHIHSCRTFGLLDIVIFAEWKEIMGSL